MVQNYSSDNDSDNIGAWKPSNNKSINSNKSAKSSDTSAKKAQNNNSVNNLEQSYKQANYKDVNMDNVDNSQPNSGKFDSRDINGKKSFKDSKFANNQIFTNPLLSTITAAVSSAIIVLIIVVGGTWAGIIHLPTPSSFTGGTAVDSAKILADSGTKIGNPNWEAVSAAVENSVVSIDVTAGQSGAQGSGVIINADGKVITNNHVIEDGSSSSSKITVTLLDGRVFDAKVLGTDSTTDIAVLQIQNPPADLKVAKIDDSYMPTVGQQVMASGNPLGLSNTVTTGIVSALDRPVAASTSTSGDNATVTNAIQIDAAVNPGNSGGPLFDGAGAVIGITSSIATTSGSSSSGSIGLGFAIPAKLVKNVSDQIISTGKAKHALLGITLSDASVTVDNVGRKGAEVKSVSNNSAAGKAGIKKGDVIVGLDNHQVVSAYSLIGFVREFMPGNIVKISYARNDKLYDVEVTLDEAPEQAKKQSQGSDQDGQNNGGGGFIDPFNFFFGN
ncbi:MAG: trypsin-like peptidase domain-containing protein [Bifidobacteriaceae bacterium]|jgi:putative serine protease PepD|nr:trypsin-like peptidase domain-containing protein [Bifidobacteriaceae bacterium]